MPFETLWCCVPPSSRSSPGRKDNACDIRSVLLVPWVVGLYRDSRGGAIVAALDAGKDSRRYDVCVVLNLVVLESGRKSLLVSRLSQSQSLADASKKGMNKPPVEDQLV